MCILFKFSLIAICSAFWLNFFRYILKLSVPLFDVVLTVSRNNLNFNSQYMIILLLVFIVQFSVSCACLALNEEQQVSKDFSHLLYYAT